MFKLTVLSAAFAAAFAIPLPASAAAEQELAAIRAQINAIKQDYEARLQALEQRFEQAQAASAAIPAPAAATAPAPAPAAANAFNPAIALVLGGTLSNLSQDPSTYRVQGFAPPAGDVGPGRRSFNLGESELTLSANIDPMFAGQLTFALSGEDTVGVEEAFVQTRALSNGFNLKAGRFLSAAGYLNAQHAHAWDFVDAPLAYQAFFGGQYKSEGVQLKWLAPTERFVELGIEAGSGAQFPGNERNKNGIGATSAFVHAGDDIGASGSWRAGLSYVRTAAAGRSYIDADPLAGGAAVTDAFSGASTLWLADAVYKWAPDGNPTRQNFKLQGEYFRRRENGTLAFDTAGRNAQGGYASAQSGWYAQGVYQFMPAWRAGLRYDRLSSGTPSIGLVENGTLAAASFPALAAYAPTRASLMFDYSPSEFSRLRLQLARDKARAGAVDNQIFLQYISSLGAHAAHAF